MIGKGEAHDAPVNRRLDYGDNLTFMQRMPVAAGKLIATGQTILSL